MLISVFLALFLINFADAAGGKRTRAKQPPKNRQLHVPMKLMNLDPNQPLMTQLVQEDFLVTPDDFSKDPDVTYVLGQLHRKQTVEMFYRNAQTVYNDLESFYKEIESDQKIAEKFHEFMKTMSAASLSRPLTVTNLILGITRHFRPIFKTKSRPIEELAKLTAFLDNEPEKKMIKLMTRFFDVYTIREMDQIQNLINLASYAGVDSITAKKEEALKMAEMEAFAPPKSKKLKSPKKRREQQPDEEMSWVGCENVFETFLKPYSERFRITIANAVTKMLILLDLFVHDPTMANRSLQLYMKLWFVHAKRLAVREKVDVSDLDARWINPALYRKFPISFLYDDWKPDILTPEAMEELRKAAAKEAQSDLAFMAEKQAQISRAKLFSNLLWIGGTFTLVASILSLIFFIYRKHKEAEFKDTRAERDENEKCEIVNNLERSVDQSI